jgi:hypothetical protein
MEQEAMKLEEQKKILEQQLAELNNQIEQSESQR